MRLHHLLTYGDGSPPMGMQQQQILSQPSPRAQVMLGEWRTVALGRTNSQHTSQGQGVTRTCTPKAMRTGPAEHVGQLMLKKIPNLVFNMRIMHKKASSVSPPTAYRSRC